jgi:hypothetical protein
MNSLTQLNALHTSQMLVVIMKRLLEKIVQSSEAAVTDVTEKLQGMTVLNEQQKEQLSGALVSFYGSEEGEDVKRILNENASAMFDAVSQGDMAKADSISKQPEYASARLASKRLHDTLQNFTTNDVALNEYIMPVLVSLQYQDNMRQEIEGIIKSMEQYFAVFTPVPTAIEGSSEEVENFWKKVAKNFNNIDARRVILETALGAQNVRDVDIRASKPASKAG